MPDEVAIRAALEALHAGEYDNVRAAAKAHGVASSTLRSRLRGNKARRDSHLKQQLLSLEQKQLLVKWVLDIKACGKAPNVAQVRDMAGMICWIGGGSRIAGKNFVVRFLMRCPDLRAKIVKGGRDCSKNLDKFADSPAFKKQKEEAAVAAAIANANIVEEQNDILQNSPDVDDDTAD